MQKTMRFICGFLVTVLAILGVGGLTSAQGADGTGSGLSITPTRHELRIERGKVDVIHISIKNVSGGDITAKVFVNDFESDNDTGEPRLITDPNRELASSIRRFLLGVEDVPLAKDEQKTIDIPVQIPENTAPGAYYGLIRYVAVPKATAAPGAGQVSLNASVGPLILIEVPGEITEQIQLRSVRIYNGSKSGQIFSKKPDHIGVEVKNTGNTFSKPFGTVTVKNMFGKEVQNYELNNSNPRANVLPGSTRIFKDELKGISSFGRYKVTAIVSYASGGDPLVSSSTFWVVPLWFVILLVLVLFAILLGGKMFYTKRFSNRTSTKRK